MIDALAHAYRLKDEPRTGWTLRRVENAESVADHSWGTAYLVLLYADEAGVDRARAVEIALVHDLAEARTGDVATRIAEMNDPARAERKRRDEQEAMAALTADYSPQQSAHVNELWVEYEARTSREARFVREMNLIDMCIQAYVYERDRRYDDTAPNEDFPDYEGLDEFFATTAPRLGTPVGRRLFEEIVVRYEHLSHVVERRGAGQ